MNKSKKTIVLLVAGALAVVGAFGAIKAGSVYAQTVTPPSTTPPNTQAQPWMGKGMRSGMRGLENNTYLAAALGITTDQLQTAYTAANAEALKQAVAKGLITQQQADQMSANGFGGPRFNGADGIDYNAILANALGISTDKLKAAMLQAENAEIDTAVTAGTITQAQADLEKGRNALYNDSTFQSSMQSAFADAVKAAVSSGVITQAQADAILQQQTQRGGFGFGFDGGRGGRHGFGGGLRPNFNGGQNSNPTQNAPTVTPSGSGL